MADKAYWEDLFAPVNDVNCRRMFGGLGIFQNSLMFALVANETLYFKVDNESKARFQETGGEPFVYTGKNKPVTMSYWTPPEDIYDDPDVLKEWATLAIDAAQRAARAKSS